MTITFLAVAGDPSSALGTASQTAAHDQAVFLQTYDTNWLIPR
jgi:hypothetical protein